MYVWALIFDIAIAAAVIFGAIRLRHSAKRLARCAGTAVLAFFCLYALYSVSKAAQPAFNVFFTYYGQVAFKALLIVAAVVAFWRFRGRALGWFRAGFLIVSPLFVLMAGQALWSYGTNDLRTVGAGHAAGMLPGAARTNRVVWIIFDELDNRLLFEARPARIHPVEFDRLRGESLYAGRVRTPARETLEAIPSMFLGDTVIHTKLNTSKLLVQTSPDSKWLNFASQPNVFRRARQDGFNTAVSGWNHPYCRILGSDLSDCAWASSGWMDVIAERHLRQLSFFRLAIFLARWEARVNPAVKEPPDLIAPEGITWFRENNIAVYDHVWQNAQRMLADRRLNLVLLHFPVPHPPGIWDITHKRFTTGKSNYFDNLQLADDTLGRVRSILESAGEWDSSTILVSGDHPYRASSWLGFSDIRTPEMVEATQMKWHPFVPFLLKLPGEQKGVTYPGEFNNIVSGDLILQILNGKISKPEDAVSWLKHAGIAETE